MKKIRYGVAMSLDGYIGAPNGEYDWIVQDPEINFAEIWAQFDTFIMGRKTYEPASARVGDFFQGMKTVVVSRTLRQADHPQLKIISELTRDKIQQLRQDSQKDIWLFGGGELFRSMLAMGEVDMIETAVIPVLLGGGVPFLPTPALQTKLRLSKHRIYSSGIVSLSYEVQK
jgi:dihydrofolate reductase